MDMISISELINFIIISQTYRSYNMAETSLISIFYSLSITEIFYEILMILYFEDKTTRFGYSDFKLFIK